MAHLWRSPGTPTPLTSWVRRSCAVCLQLEAYHLHLQLMCLKVGVTKAGGFILHLCICLHHGQHVALITTRAPSRGMCCGGRAAVPEDGQIGRGVQLVVQRGGAQRAAAPRAARPRGGIVGTLVCCALVGYVVGMTACILIAVDAASGWQPQHAVPASHASAVCQFVMGCM
jgi:hypothetical protein